MTAIYRYELEIKDTQIVFIPKGGEILCVQTQFGIACMWVKVLLTNPREQRMIRIFGTGHPLNEKLTYIGTIQNGIYVWHVFEGQD